MRLDCAANDEVTEHHIDAKDSKEQIWGSYKAKHEARLVAPKTVIGACCVNEWAIKISTQGAEIEEGYHDNYQA